MILLFGLLPSWSLGAAGLRTGTLWLFVLALLGAVASLAGWYATRPQT